jgi:hypothetical protein
MFYFHHIILCSKLEAERQWAQPTECRGLLPQGTLNEGEYTIMISYWLLIYTLLLAFQVSRKGILGSKYSAK